MILLVNFGNLLVSPAHYPMNSVSRQKNIPEAHRDKVKLRILDNLDLRQRPPLERIERYDAAAEHEGRF
jgi:hypothetical protein